MKYLKKKELKELIGGLYTQPIATDIKNNNSVIGCSCHYNDNSAIENNNTIEGCKCNCLHKANTD
ncbi:MAG: hypothetical protein RBS19_05685 [Bacteroidales bacterium]|jgi:hypothetical protein|nr:hypothetical protein [Bacteroidales bacterium]